MLPHHNVCDQPVNQDTNSLNFMSILEILQHPDPRLRRIAVEVENVNDARVQQIIDDMIETLRATKDCAALAATQLDIDHPPSITVINQRSGISLEPLCLINPRIKEKSGVAREEEGCMSVYPKEISALVKRATKVKITAQDRHGQHLEIDAEDFFARCLQHEIDHLHGILYIDYLSRLKRSMLEKKIAKLNSPD